MRRLPFLALVVPLLALRLCAEDPAPPVERPPDAWASFKPGSWVRKLTVTVMERGPMPVETRIESVETVIDVGEAGAVVETVSDTTVVVNDHEKKQPRKREQRTMQPVPWAPPEAQAEEPGVVRKVGEESLSVGGGSVKCAYLKLKRAGAPEAPSMTSNLWISKEVPGFLVKSELDQRLPGGREGKLQKQTVTVQVLEYFVAP